MIKAHGELLNDSSAQRTEDWKPVMKVDKRGIPHDFCTTEREFDRRQCCALHLTSIQGNSIIMAGEVNAWIDRIIKAHDEVLSHER